MFKHFFVSVFVLLIIPGQASGQDDDPYSEEVALFREFVKKQMEADHIPGLSVGFYKDGYQWSEGFGYADLENDVEATPHTAYRLASNTKSMTALAILQLQEEGKLNIDDPVKRYVPYFPRKKWDITIRQVMGHIGGISHYQDYEEEGHIKTHKGTRGSLAIFDGFELVARPGTEYNYSSYGYNLLGAVVEGAANKPFGDYLREKIWEPLDMDNTWMDDPHRIIPHRADGYRLVFGELKKSEFVNVSSRFAAGGTRSTVVDMLRYARGLNEQKVLSKQSTRMMETTMNTADGMRTDYGMGWHIAPVNGHFQAYHTGGQPETRTMLMRFPTRDFAIALAYNLEGGSLRSIARRLYQLVMDEGWNVRPFTGHRYDDALLEGMWEIYNYGMAYYDRRSKPRNTDPEDMQQMFDFLNNTLNPDKLKEDFEKVEKKIHVGRHPKAQTAYVRIGSYMVHKLVQKYGRERLEYYHKQGAPAFFSDYLKLSAEEGHRWAVNEAMKEKIRQYHGEWSQTWNKYTRQLYIGSWSELGSILDRLRKQAEGKTLHPDYTSVLAAALFDKAIQEGPASVLPLAEDFASLYPESAIPYVIHGNLAAMAGRADHAESLYRQALDAAVDRHAVGAGLLNHYAGKLFENDKLQKALELVDVARRIHPGNGRLLDTRGDIYAEMSRRAYREALRKNPGLEETHEELKELEQ